MIQNSNNEFTTRFKLKKIRGLIEIKYALSYAVAHSHKKYMIGVNKKPCKLYLQGFLFINSGGLVDFLLPVCVSDVFFCTDVRVQV